MNLFGFTALWNYKKVYLIKIYLSDNSSLIKHCFSPKLVVQKITNNWNYKSLLILIKVKITVCHLHSLLDNWWQKDGYEILVWQSRPPWPCCQPFIINSSRKLGRWSWVCDPLRRASSFDRRTCFKPQVRNRINRCEKQLCADHSKHGKGEGKIQGPDKQ